MTRRTIASWDREFRFDITLLQETDRLFFD